MLTHHINENYAIYYYYDDDDDELQIGRVPIRVIFFFSIYNYIVLSCVPFYVP